MKKIDKGKTLEKILKKVKPYKFQKIMKYKGNLLDDNILDSFDIIKIISLIEEESGKKINFSKIKRINFANFEKIKNLI